MPNKNYIEFQVESSHFVAETICYEVDVFDKNVVNTPSLTLASVNDAGDFLIEDGMGGYIPFPYAGITSTSTGLNVRCLIPPGRTSGMILCKEGEILRTSGDNAAILDRKTIQNLGAGRCQINPETNDAWISCGTKTVVGFSPVSWNMVGSLNTATEYMDVLIDFKNKTYWQIDSDVIYLKKMSGETIFTFNTPDVSTQPIDTIYAAAIEPMSGSLFVSFSSNSTDYVLSMERLPAATFYTAGYASSFSPYKYSSMVMTDESDEVFEFESGSWPATSLFSLGGTSFTRGVGSPIDDMFYLFDVNSSSIIKHSISAPIWVYNITTSEPDSMNIKVDHGDRSTRYIRYLTNDVSGSIRDTATPAGFSQTFDWATEPVYGDLMSWYPAQTAYANIRYMEVP